MMIVPLQKGIRGFELHKKAVVSHLGQPVDKIEDVFHRLGSFDADAAVAHKGTACIGSSQLFGTGQGRGEGTLDAGAQKTESDGTQIGVHTQKHAAGIYAADAAAVGCNVKGVLVIFICGRGGIAIFGQIGADDKLNRPAQRGTGQQGKVALQLGSGIGTHRAGAVK